MLRPIPVIVAAILLSQPRMDPARARSYARTLQQEAVEHRFDPFTGVAIVHYESRWRAGAISRDGEDLGLAQVRARYVGACRKDPSPVRAPGRACRAVRGRLLEPHTSLRHMAAAITHWRRYCRRRTGRPALFARWLSGYQGYEGRPGVTCNQVRRRGRWRDLPAPSLTLRVMRYRRQLVRRFR